MATETTLRTWTLVDRGYDCDQQGERWDCTAETFIGAVQMLAPKFKQAAHAEPINSIHGCSTYAVYARAPRNSGATWDKIGVVYVAGVRDACLRHGPTRAAPRGRARHEKRPTMTTFRDYLKLKAAALERVAQQKTEAVPVAELQAAAERNVADSQPVCEFCGSNGAAGCGVCRVLDGVTEAELTAK